MNGTVPDGDPRPAAVGSPAQPVPLGPVRETERIASLDVLRGFALLGILVVNMQFFAMPFMTALHDPSLAGAPVASQLAWALTKILFEFKFVSLFSLLFGMGLVLQMRRAEAAGRSFAPLYLRRLAVLFVVGAVHALSLWYGDILLLYSVLGVALLLCRRLGPRWLLVGGAACVAVAALLFTLTTAVAILVEHFEEPAAPVEEPDANGSDVAPGSKTRTASDGGMQTKASASEGGRGEQGGPEDEGRPGGTGDSQSKPPSGLAAIVEARGDPEDPRWIEGEIAAYKHGPFLHALAFRAVTFAYSILAAIFGYGWRVLGLFLAGAALVKLDFFASERRRWHARLAMTGLGVGLPIEILGACIIHAVDYEISWPSLGAALLHEVGSLLLCLGYVGLVARIVASGTMTGLCRTLGCVGRLALSNYLAQTLVATFIMYWWGLGWFGDLSRPWQMMLALGIYGVLAATSVIWLRRFTIGPAEWIWRSLTYGRLEPMRR